MNNRTDIRIERNPNTGASGTKLRHQLIYMGMEEYVFIPEKHWRDLRGNIIETIPAVMRHRPIYRHVTHQSNPTVRRYKKDKIKKK